jgi:subtilisin family serine protease
VNDAGTRIGCTNGVVGSLSLGGIRSTSVNSATANAVDAGIFMAVAAGNEAQDSSNVSPASEATAYTVGATDSLDRFAPFSNFGSAIDVFAPGVAILSTWLNDGTVRIPSLYHVSRGLTLRHRTPSLARLWLLLTSLVLLHTSLDWRVRRPLIDWPPASMPSRRKTPSLAYPPAQGTF